MPKSEHLIHAPIVEALLDIRVSLPDSVSNDDLAAVQQRLGGRYPAKQVRRIWSGHLAFPPDGPPQAKASEEKGGYQFTSADAKEVVQSRPDGFAFSRLHPYTDWDTFSSLAKAAWKHYAKELKPRTVNRIALRYINRLPLPLPLSDLADYLRTGPSIAPDLPQDLKTFFFRSVLLDDEAKATVIVTEAVEESGGDTTKLPLILDIDVFRAGVFPTDAEKLWGLFAPLHDLKNRVFFGSITDATRELFK